MAHLYELLEEAVAKWRADGYPIDEFPAVGEVLEWAGETEEGELRYLRRPQIRALETYWYLRLAEGTPHIFDLYARLYGDDRAALLEALEVPDPAFRDANYDLDALWERVRDDDDFVRSFRLDALRETLALDYPSYILALAMGAGKTVLIGAIVATEFAMALEYPDGPFVQNALVFAPGRTIVESLRELNRVPYERILPPRLYKPFAASVKITFTRDGEKEISVVRGSAFNLVVTNTEKIRIQKETIRKSEIGRLFDPDRVEEARADVANLRLQAIASLPHLAVFSDEAHHTYGQRRLQGDLKKVRKTVDYLGNRTNLICVVNTTGTPYVGRQPLKDVVAWYSLSEGIRDGILKDVSGNIRGYEFSDQSTDAYVREVISDFFVAYGDVRLLDGAPAKLAMYFPQTDDLEELRPVIDQALVEVGLSPAHALVNTSNPSLTSQTDIDAFNRLNDPEAPHRLVLLVNKGTEGWNCPSLFGCALARKLKTSNNFVLQAASRCLRQVAGNTRQARIYLSQENYGILDRQLSETYGETIKSLNERVTERRTARLVLRKPDHPPLRVLHSERFVVRHDEDLEPLRLKRPEPSKGGLRQRVYTLADHQMGRRVLRQIEDTVEVEALPDTLDVYAAATELTAQYRLNLWQVYDEVRRLYGAEDVPVSDLDDLAAQIEQQTRVYTEHEEVRERALAIVRPEGFRHDEDRDVYVAEILYPKDREELLLRMSDLEAMNAGGFGFHYDPYNFDSKPERDFFDSMLRHMNIRPSEVDDIYFTGGITDPAKTDFFVEYRDHANKWRRYTPDFVIRKKPARGEPPGSGKVLIVEIKGENYREDPVNGEKGAKAMAVQRWADLNPDRLQYEIYFAPRDMVPHDALESARAFVGGGDGQGPRIPVDRGKVEEFCRRWKITELSFFGSVLTDDFGPDSDVDVMVTFADDAEWGLEIVDMADELSGMFGRGVDLVTRRSIEESENWIRRKAILEGAESYVVTG
jgi:type III restriction enzyme